MKRSATIKRRDLIVASLLLVLGIISVCCVAICTQGSIHLHELTHHPGKYHNRIVTVRGKVVNCDPQTSIRGHDYYTFTLREGRDEVTVFAFGTLPIHTGQVVTVRGTYTRVKVLGPWKFVHEIDATYGNVQTGIPLVTRLRERFLH